MPSSPTLSFSGHSSIRGRPALVAGMSPVAAGAATLSMPSEMTPMRTFLPLTRSRFWTRSARSAATPSDSTDPASTLAPTIGVIRATPAWAATAIDLGGRERRPQDAAIVADPGDAHTERADRRFGGGTTAQVDAGPDRAVGLDPEDRQAAPHRADPRRRCRISSGRGALVGAQQRADLDLLAGARRLQRPVARQGRVDLGAHVRRQRGVGLPRRGIDLKGALDEGIGEDARVGLLGPCGGRGEQARDDQHRPTRTVHTQRQSDHGQLLRKPALLDERDARAANRPATRRRC